MHEWESRNFGKVCGIYLEWPTFYIDFICAKHAQFSAIIIFPSSALSTPWTKPEWNNRLSLGEYGRVLYIMSYIVYVWRSSNMVSMIFFLICNRAKHGNLETNIIFVDYRLPSNITSGWSMNFFGIRAGSFWDTYSNKKIHWCHWCSKKLSHEFSFYSSPKKVGIRSNLWLPNHLYGDEDVGTLGK